MTFTQKLHDFPQFTLYLYMELLCWKDTIVIFSTKFINTAGHTFLKSISAQVMCRHRLAGTHPFSVGHTTSADKPPLWISSTPHNQQKSSPLKKYRGESVWPIGVVHTELACICTVYSAEKACTEHLLATKC